MMLPLVLYDILSELPGNNWSANPAKPRFVLSYKELPFVTIWVEYSDISIAMKSIGAKPSKRRNGSDTYPEKPIFPNNSEPMIRAFDSAYMSLILPGFKPMLPRTIEILSPASAKFFIGTLSVDVPLPLDVNFDAEWKLLEKGYNTAYEWYQKTDGKWIMGDTFSYADIIDDEWARISSWNGGKWAKVLEDVEKECNLA
ncbi:hypothetical protein F4604DRAFT_1879410 [Suillus subluteus]|nr:hypothetical protein F4604DRAFT_1879410 [Suillus subluteus]